MDWGTTNRRVYMIDDGEVVRSERDDRGVSAVGKAGFASEVEGIRSRFGDLPMLLAGMIGSNIGWRMAPYVPAPAGLSALAEAMLWIDPRTAIVPGLSTIEHGRRDSTQGDPMRSDPVRCDVAARMADAAHETVHILADPGLGALYAAAIEANGRQAGVIDSNVVFAAGIIRIGALIA